jgi:hypothetical protein
MGFKLGMGTIIPGGSKSFSQALLMVLKTYTACPCQSNEWRFLQRKA